MNTKNENCELRKKLLKDCRRVVVKAGTRLLTDHELLPGIVRQIKEILQMSSPYKEIYKLPGLNEQFSDRYSAILDDLLVPVSDAIKEAQKRVEEEMDKQDCRSMFGKRCADRFGELKTKAESCNNVASLQNIKIEADALKVRFLNEISTYIAKRAKEEEEKRTPVQTDEFPPSVMHEDPNAAKPATPPVSHSKQYKTISIKSVNTSTTWQLETQEDVQKYITALQNKLNSLLEKDTVINIEF